MFCKGSNLGERQPRVFPEEYLVKPKSPQDTLRPRCSVWSSELGHHCLNLPCSILESQGSLNRKEMGVDFYLPSAKYLS